MNETITPNLYLRYREAVKAIFGFTVRRLMLSSKGAILFSLMLVPWAIVLLLEFLISKRYIVGMNGSLLYNLLITLFYIPFLIPVCTLFFGVALIADEVEGGTVGYLFGRPIPRSLWLIVKFLGTIAVIEVGVVFSIFVSYLLTHISSHGVFSHDIGNLKRDSLAAALGIAAYTSLFTLIGLVFKIPHFWGICIAFGWENLAGWLPGFLKRFTILFHLHTLCPQYLNQANASYLKAAPESETAAWMYLVVFLLLFLVLACWKISRIEVLASREE